MGHDMSTIRGSNRKHSKLANCLTFMMLNIVMSKYHYEKVTAVPDL
jgi:hypothetical protein